MPRSRSRSIRSRYWARIVRSSTVWVSSSIRSANVDLPWSICATMQKFRIREMSVATTVHGTGRVAGRGGPEAAGRLPHPYGQHQVTDQAEQAERDASRAEQGRQERP